MLEPLIPSSVSRYLVVKTVGRDWLWRVNAGDDTWYMCSVQSIVDRTALGKVRIDNSTPSGELPKLAYQVRQLYVNSVRFDADSAERGHAYKEKYVNGDIMVLPSTHGSMGVFAFAGRTNAHNSQDGQWIQLISVSGSGDGTFGYLPGFRTATWARNRALGNAIKWFLWETLAQLWHAIGLPHGELPFSPDERPNDAHLEEIREFLSAFGVRGIPIPLQCVFSRYENAKN